MRDWEIAFAKAGQELYGYLKDNPSRGREVTEQLQQQVLQIKGGRGHKNSDGTHNSSTSRKDKGQMRHEATVNLKTPGNDDVAVTRASLLEAFAELGAKTGKKYRMREEEEDEDEDEDYGYKLTLADKRETNRQVSMQIAREFSFRLQSRQMFWESVRLMGKVVLVGSVLIGLAYVATRIWRGPSDGPMPDIH